MSYGCGSKSKPLRSFKFFVFLKSPHVGVPGVHFGQAVDTLASSNLGQSRPFFVSGFIVVLPLEASSPPKCSGHGYGHPDLTENYTFAEIDFVVKRAFLRSSNEEAFKLITSGGFRSLDDIVLQHQDARIIALWSFELNWPLLYS